MGILTVLQRPPLKADQRIAYGEDAFQFGDLWLPEGAGPHAVVIFIHGGFWRAAYNLDHASHLSAALRESGMAVWSLEYRRIGNPGGGWPGTFDDIGQGAVHLKNIAGQYALDLNRVLAMGHSAGGHLAYWLAAEKPIALSGTISLAGVVDLERAWELRLSNNVVADLIGGAPGDWPDRYASASPIERLPIRIPLRLIHGRDDTIVPLELSERFTERARERGDNVQLIALSGAGHFEVIDPLSAAWTVVEAAVLQMLK